MTDSEKIKDLQIQIERLRQLVATISEQATRNFQLMDERIKLLEDRGAS